MFAPSIVLDPIAGFLGLPADLFKLFTVFLISIPLSYVHGKLEQEQQRHIFNIACGLILGWIVLDWSVLHAVITTGVTWALMQFAPREQQHLMVLAFAFGYLTISHLYRMWNDWMGYTMDFTAAQMVLTLKASMTAFNLADAKLPTSYFKDPDQKAMLADRILKPPAPLDYFSYMFYFPTFHTGPVITFNHFRVFSKRLPSQREQLENGIRRATVLKALQVLLWGAIHALGIFLPYKFCIEPKFREWASLPARLVYVWIATSLYRFQYYAVWTLAEVACVASGMGASVVEPADGTDLDSGRFTSSISPRPTEGGQKNLIQKAIESVGSAAVTQGQGNAAGTTTPAKGGAGGAKGPHTASNEAALLLGKVVKPLYDNYYGPNSGLRGPDGVAHDACTNVDVWGVEFPDNIKMVTDNWNISVGRFFRVYVYGRLMPRDGRRPPASLVNITQLTSAFWHGFYPGYYLFFGIMSGITNMARLMRTLVRPVVLKYATEMPQVKIMYDVAGAFAAAILLNTTGITFLLLDWRLGLTAWRNIWFIPPIISLAGPYAMQYLAPHLKRMARTSEKPSAPAKAAAAEDVQDVRAERLSRKVE